MKKNLHTKYFQFTYNDVPLNEKPPITEGKSPHIFVVIGGVECICCNKCICNCHLTFRGHLQKIWLQNEEHVSDHGYEGLPNINCLWLREIWNFQISGNPHRPHCSYCTYQHTVSQLPQKPCSNVSKGNAKEISGVAPTSGLIEVSHHYLHAGSSICICIKL